MTTTTKPWKASLAMCCDRLGDGWPWFARDDEIGEYHVFLDKMAGVVFCPFCGERFQIVLEPAG